MRLTVVVRLQKSIEKRMPRPGSLSGARKAFGRRDAYPKAERQIMPRPGSLAGVREALGRLDAHTEAQTDRQ